MDALYYSSTENHRKSRFGASVSLCTICFPFVLRFRSIIFPCKLGPPIEATTIYCLICNKRRRHVNIMSHLTVAMKSFFFTSWRLVMPLNETKFYAVNFGAFPKTVNHFEPSFHSFCNCKCKCVLYYLQDFHYNMLKRTKLIKRKLVLFQGLSSKVQHIISCGYFLHNVGPNKLMQMKINKILWRMLND